MKKIFVVFVVLTLAFTLTAKDHKIIRVKKSLDGILVNSEDILSVLSFDRNVAKLPQGNYQIGFVMRFTPIFYIGEMAIKQSLKKDSALDMAVQLNKEWTQAKGDYFLISSLPGFEWVRYPLFNHSPFRLVVFDAEKNYLAPAAIIDGDTRRDIKASRI